MKTNVLLIFVALCLCACSESKRNVSNSILWKNEIELREKEGWKYKETLGSPIDNALLMGYGTSATARTVSGFWTENGQRHDKKYSQDREIFYIISFQAPSGDAFSIVLYKDKNDSPRQP